MNSLLVAQTSSHCPFCLFVATWSIPLLLICIHLRLPPDLVVIQLSKPSLKRLTLCKYILITALDTWMGRIAAFLPAGFNLLAIKWNLFTSFRACSSRYWSTFSTFSVRPIHQLSANRQTRKTGTADLFWISALGGRPQKKRLIDGTMCAALPDQVGRPIIADPLRINWINVFFTCIHLFNLLAVAA